MKKKKLKVPYGATIKDFKYAKMIRRAAYIQLKKDLDFYLSEGSLDMAKLASVIISLQVFRVFVTHTV